MRLNGHGPLSVASCSKAPKRAGRLWATMAQLTPNKRIDGNGARAGQSETGVKDKATVSAEGEALSSRIDGVVIHRRPLLEDDRGELVEIYNPAWGIHPAPLVYAYLIGIRPGRAKGWVLHAKQDDRLFILQGTVRIGLFDNRPNSPTYRMLNVFVMGDRNRGLITIPQGVFHAIKNIGTGDAFFLNLPTRAYDHADPDKYRLPLENDLIPFSFEEEGNR
jgi:dTDP-4-dehydrorhamnose 3,5-epimerase